jgi:hypothetical protein
VAQSTPVIVILSKEKNLSRSGQGSCIECEPALPILTMHVGSTTREILHYVQNDSGLRSPWIECETLLPFQTGRVDTKGGHGEPPLPGGIRDRDLCQRDFRCLATVL